MAGSEEEYIFRSALPAADIPYLSLPEFLGSCIARHGDQEQVAYIDGPTGRSYTLSQVTDLVKRVAAGLAAKGIKQHDVVMILAPNLPEYGIAFLGIASLGAIVTTCNPMYGPREISKQLSDCQAKLIFTVEALVPTLEEAGIKLPIVCFGPTPAGLTPFEKLVEADPWNAPTVYIHPEDTLALPYSSGTTGVAKGVELTHHNLVSNLIQGAGGPAPVFLMHQTDVLLGLLPFFHIYGMTTLILTPLMKCIPIVIMPKFDLIEMLELIQKHRITLANLVPPIILALTKHPVVSKYDLSSMRGIMSGAAPLGKELQIAAQKRLGFTIAQGYGMTESSPITIVTRNVSARPCECTPGSAGSIVINTEGKIRDPVSGKALPPNKRGELCLRGPQVMKGYFNKPEATAETVDKDGWLLTGDVAYVNERGEVFVVDRVKELIKYKGFQVPPAELEALLVNHPAIADAAVIGIPDEEAGELPMGFIKLAEGQKITAGEVQEYIAKQVVYYKRLRAVEFVEEIPKSAAGKILRKDLRARVAARLSKSKL